MLKISICFSFRAFDDFKLVCAVTDILALFVGYVLVLTRAFTRSRLQLLMYKYVIFFE
eukprot:c10449_g2_i1 orf=179-352(+)